MLGKSSPGRAILPLVRRSHHPDPAGIGGTAGRAGPRRRLAIAALLAAMPLAPLAGAMAAGAAEPAAGDPRSGERVFATQCRACHSIEQGGHNRLGPNLHDVFGRRAGAAPGFRYSRAMRAKAEAGLVWDADTLRAYLANPRAVVPGTAMTFVGLRNERQIADLLAYLERASAAD